MVEDKSGWFAKLIRGIGPAIIVACIVLGPGSILTSSKVGCEFGTMLVWVLVAAGVLMLGAIATAARVGVSLKKSPLGELSDRLGRPFAIVVGVNVFLIATCFQFSNNLGVLAAIEPLVEVSTTARWVILLALNSFIVFCLFGLKKLYDNVERLMMVLMALMLIGFLANLLMARPSLIGFFKGLVPRLPQELTGAFLPKLQAIPGAAVNAKPVLIDPWIAVQGLIATSFSIAGAFYQAYLVREKGWTRGDARRGLTDSIIGTSVLIGVSLMIMLTAATVLIGKIAPADLKSAGDVAVQLEPLFGPSAKWLFCIGIFAGAISSFLVNSVLGGTLLADGLGQDSSIDSTWTKIYTVGALMIGMLVALMTTSEARVPLIIFAQAMTVLGGPILVFSLLYLATRKANTASTESGQANQRVAPNWMIGLTSVGALVVIALAFRTLLRIYLTVANG